MQLEAQQQGGLGKIGVKVATIAIMTVKVKKNQVNKNNKEFQFQIIHRISELKI